MSIGSDWYLILFLTFLQSFLIFHGLVCVAYHVYYFHILLLVSVFFVFCILGMFWLLFCFFKRWVIVCFIYDGVAS